jgi:aryl-alcohol dehydrogenase-like predicted oxidoreductase
MISEENIEKNVALVERLGEIAAKKRTTVSQLAFAWMMSKGVDIIPLIGSLSPAHIQEALQSMDIRFTEYDIKEIEEAVPENEIAGTSFPNRKFRNGKAI